jgi:glycosyltransferase involved in cell wall biosynthesis
VETYLRIAMLSYRCHPEVGGQGVYVSHLTEALAALGHEVTVFSGPPYPELDHSVELRRVPSLDLYRPEDPFRRPARAEFRDWIDVLEYAAMCAGTFPEPLTFSLRMARMRDVLGAGFDVVHDNQTLGYGMLALRRATRLVTTIHHPISIDRRLALADTDGALKRLGKRRWYGFVAMQRRVAKRLDHLVTVSEATRTDIVQEFGVKEEAITVVHNGVDADLFKPIPQIRREPGRIVTVASSDQASKGLGVLVEAVAKLRTERDAKLVVIGRGSDSPLLVAAAARFGIEVERLGRVTALKMVEEMARAQVAVVPSLYEGFSLPAAEAMSCGVPLVATTGGALPEVVGDAGLLVEPGDAHALATAIASLLDDGSLSSDLGRRGRERVLARFTWRQAALRMEELYRTAIGKPPC